jgi:polyketide cyclase/dehydrase/lipid transport protein
MEGDTFTVTASAQVGAAPARVYGIIANYRTGHGRILPDEFSGLTVERGGIGAGTVIRFQMRVFGRTQTFRGEVTEPLPGRVLVETYDEPNRSVTTFIVEDGARAGGSHVTIKTELKSRSGWRGAIERSLATLYLSRVYRKELAKLDAVATEPAAAVPQRKSA